VEEGERVGQVIELVEDCTSDLDDGKLGRLGWIRRRREDAKVALHLAFSTKRVEETSDRILREIESEGSRSVGIDRTSGRVGRCGHSLCQFVRQIGWNEPICWSVDGRQSAQGMRRWPF